MSEPLRPEALEMLVCKAGRRPEAAPTIVDILGPAQSVRHEAATLIVDFDPAAAEVVGVVLWQPRTP